MKESPPSQKMLVTQAMVTATHGLKYFKKCHIAGTNGNFFHTLNESCSFTSARLLPFYY